MVTKRIEQGRRAHRAEDKEARRLALLEAAFELFEGGEYAGVTVAAVARRAGLAKGTLFLYFPTKEALFLALLEQRLDAWLDEVDLALEGGRGRWTNARVARCIADTLSARRPLVRLLVLLGGVLEQNVEVEQVAAFKRALVARLARTGALLERRSRLAGGQGARALLRVYALVIGLWQLTAPGPAARAALERPELASLVVDFDEELAPSLTALLDGMADRTEKRR